MGVFHVQIIFGTKFSIDLMFNFLFYWACSFHIVEEMKGMVALGDTCIIGDCGAIAVLHWSTETCLLVSDSLVKISRDLF